MHNVSTFVESQVSQYVADTFPKFTEFLKVYYEYVEQVESAHGLINYHRALNDVDDTTDSELNKFYFTYGEYLPKEFAYDKRNLIKFLNELYNAKGTKKALILLFKLLFNTEIQVSYPSEDMLRASDGNWVFERFIVINTILGTRPAETDLLNFFNDANKFIRVVRVEIIDTVRTKVFFTTPQNITFTVGEKLKKYTDGIVTFVGRIEATLIGIKVLEPGYAWMNGQIIQMPGTVKDSTLKVTKTNNGGKISSVAIIEYGLEHSPDQTIQISSYPLKPIGSSFDITTGTNEIHITLKDEISDFTEQLRGYSDALFDEPNENRVSYTQPGVYSKSNTTLNIGDPGYEDEFRQIFYTGVLVIDFIAYTSASIVNQNDSDLTMNEWLLSRAKLQCVFGAEGRTFGHYTNSSGHLSNDVNRLQDNLYYQAFSYLISTKKDIKDYKELLNITHPAGTVRFSSLEKEFLINEFELAASAVIGYITNDTYLEFNQANNGNTDVYHATESVKVNLGKLFNESILTLAESFGFKLGKAISETIAITDAANAVPTYGSTYAESYFSQTGVDAYVGPFTKLQID